MDVSRYRHDTQKILHQALLVAKRFGHPFLEVEHVAYCLVKLGYVLENANSRDATLDFLSKHLEKSPKIYGLKKIGFGRRLKRCLEKVESQYETIDIPNLWKAMLDESTLLKMITQQSLINDEDNQEETHTAAIVASSNNNINPENETKKDNVSKPKKGERQKSIKKIESFVVDLSELAEKGLISPIFGREKEIKNVLQILGRHKKNNPMLIGDPGVGKSALAEGVAWWLLNNQSSDILKNMRVLSIDIGALIAGTKYRGEFEERMKALVDLAAEDPGRFVFFIDEAHMIIGAGNQEGGADIANLLKPALARGLFRCMAATTYNEYKQSIQKDAALVRRFQTIFIQEPTPEETFNILKGLKPTYEKHHQVKIAEDALHTAIELSMRYLPSQKLPDKALDLIDEAASLHALNQWTPPNVNRESVVKLVEEKFGISVSSTKPYSENHSLINLEKRMAQHVFGQWGALKRLGKALRRSHSGLGNPHNPWGSFLFLGPQGVGKQAAAQQLAFEIFSDSSRIVTIDLSEYAQESSIYRLIGSPPGLLGYDEGGLLCDMMKQKPFSVVYFNHLDQAHENIASLLVQVLENGKITDQTGRVADFTNAVVIFSITMQEKNFNHWADHGSLPTWDQIIQWSESSGEQEIRKKLCRFIRPDLVNRIDEVILFRNLSSVHLRRIIDHQVKEINARLKKKDLKIQLGNELTEFLILEGKKIGASGIKRLINRYVLDDLAERLLLDPSAMVGQWQVEWDEGGQLVWISTSKINYPTAS